LTRREEVIVQLLERFQELVEPAGGNGIPGSGDYLPLMPATYTPSVRELERLLIRMRDERRSQWWHVTERYLRCQHVNRDVPVKRKGKNGKTVTVVERQLVVTFHPGVRAEKVRRGISWLAEEWRLGHEPMIPQELMVAA